MCGQAREVRLRLIVLTASFSQSYCTVSVISSNAHLALPDQKTRRTKADPGAWFQDQLGCPGFSWKGAEEQTSNGLAWCSGGFHFGRGCWIQCITYCLSRQLRPHGLGSPGQGRAWPPGPSLKLHRSIRRIEAKLNYYRHTPTLGSFNPGILW